MKQPLLPLLRSSLLQPLHSISLGTGQPQVKANQGVNPPDIFSMNFCEEMCGDCRDSADTVMPTPTYEQCSQIFTWPYWYQGLPRINSLMIFLALEVFGCISKVLQGTGCPLPLSLLSAFMTQFVTGIPVSVLEESNSQLLTPDWVGEKCVSMKQTFWESLCFNTA